MARGPLTWRNVGESTGAGPGFAAGSAALLKSARESAVLGAKAFTDLGELKEKAKTGELLAELQALENPETFAADAAALYARYKPGNINQELYTEKHDTRRTLMDTLQTNESERRTNEAERQKAIVETEYIPKEFKLKEIETQSTADKNKSESAYNYGALKIRQNAAAQEEWDRNAQRQLASRREEIENALRKDGDLRALPFVPTDDPDLNALLLTDRSNMVQEEDARRLKNRNENYARLLPADDYNKLAVGPIIGTEGDAIYPTTTQRQDIIKQGTAIAEEQAGKAAKIAKEAMKMDFLTEGDTFTQSYPTGTPIKRADVIAHFQNFAKVNNLPVSPPEIDAMADTVVARGEARNKAFRERETDFSKKWKNLVTVGVKDMVGNWVSWNKTDQDDATAYLELTDATEEEKYLALKQSFDVENGTPYYFKGNKFDPKIFLKNLKVIRGEDPVTTGRQNLEESLSKPRAYQINAG